MVKGVEDGYVWRRVVNGFVKQMFIFIWGNETNPGRLVYIGDYTAQLYRDYNN